MNSKFSEHQIIQILKEQESGTSAVELSRKYGLSKNTLYNWKNKYKGMEGSEMRRLKLLEDENARLKKLYAELSLENYALKDVIAKKL